MIRSGLTKSGQITLPHAPAIHLAVESPSRTTDFPELDKRPIAESLTEAEKGTIRRPAWSDRAVQVQQAKARRIPFAGSDGLKRRPARHRSALGCPGSWIREQKITPIAGIVIDISGGFTTMWLWIAWIQHSRLCPIQPAAQWSNGSPAGRPRCMA